MWLKYFVWNLRRSKVKEATPEKVMGLKRLSEPHSKRLGQGKHDGSGLARWDRNSMVGQEQQGGTGAAWWGRGNMVGHESVLRTQELELCKF